VGGMEVWSYSIFFHLVQRKATWSRYPDLTCSALWESSEYPPEVRKVQGYSEPRGVHSGSPSGSCWCWNLDPGLWHPMVLRPFLIALYHRVES
jgi:hypothetical protein